MKRGGPGLYKAVEPYKKKMEIILSDEDGLKKISR
jgi:hypothetical protein